MNAKKSLIIALLALVLTATGCAWQSGAASAPGPEAAALPAELSASAESGPASLELGAPEVLPAGVSYAGGVFTVTEPGTYRVTGACAGTLAVDAGGPVELVLSGVRLTGAPCVEVLSDSPVSIKAEAGTENVLSDGAGAPDESAHAVIYSKGPLAIGGAGAVTVTAGAGSGIQSRDGLALSCEALAVRAANHGLKVRGALSVSGGSVSITAGNDGMHVEAARLSEGGVYISGGAVDITAGNRGIDGENAVSISGGCVTLAAAGDGIRADTVAMDGADMALTTGGDGVQALTALAFSGGRAEITAGGGGGAASEKSGDMMFGPPGGRGQTAAEESTASAKGFKSDGSIDISGGMLVFDTADDSIHCATLCTIAGGDITIVSSDDAIHSDDMLVVNDGSITIDDCFEGLEAFAIEVNGGHITLRSVNDGINANGPEMMGFGPPGASQETAAEPVSLSGEAATYYRQTGGTVDIVVTGTWGNVGDGVDSNGSFYLSGGVLTVSTRGDTQEGGIDIGRGELLITGGQLMAGGASMMQEGVSENSTQCSAVLAVELQPAGTAVTIADAGGREIWSVTMADTFNCLVLSHPGMTRGNVYTVTYGSGSRTLDFTDATVINMAGGFGFGGFPGGGMPRPF